MAVQIGDTAPNFVAETTEVNINFYDRSVNQKTDLHRINLLNRRPDRRIWCFSVGGPIFSQLGSLQHNHIHTGVLRLETSSQSGFTFCPNGHGDST
jgi:hypothetical protein